MAAKRKAKRIRVRVRKMKFVPEVAPTPSEFSLSRAQADMERRHAVQCARAGDALAILMGVLKVIPSNGNGLVTIGLSVEQARAVAAVLGRVL